ncbi:metal ABC transporter solute-binding protein, Zn/Mn family [Thorsellia kenyensis]|uniref:Metal ABC transporter solute-binding protein, Zn/Mn family n=1 Tax=Thorsellia kenyensis TaxID=1549888 RepID=A0ABV6CA71_9GAMM
MRQLFVLCFKSLLFFNIFTIFIASQQLIAKEPETNKKKLVISTTFTILQDIAQNIVGDKGTVVSITKPGAEIHDYEPTPKDIQKIQNSDLIIYNGMNLEAWFDKFYQDIATTPKLIATDSIKPIYVKDEKGNLTQIPNPHAWMSPKNALIYVTNIKNALITIDPSNKEYYESNAAAYANQIVELSQRFEKRLARVSNDSQSKWLVTSEGAFSYLASDYNLNEAYIYPINTEGQVKPKQLSALIDLVNAYKIPVIFSETTTSDRPAKTIVEETNAHYGGQLYVDSLSESDGEVPTYLSLLETTLSRIALGYETIRDED